MEFRSSIFFFSYICFVRIWQKKFFLFFVHNWNDKSLNQFWFSLSATLFKILHEWSIVVAATGKNFVKKMGLKITQLKVGKTHRCSMSMSFLVFVCGIEQVVDRIISKHPQTKNTNRIYNTLIRMAQMEIQWASSILPAVTVLPRRRRCCCFC